MGGMCRAGVAGGFQVVGVDDATVSIIAVRQGAIPQVTQASAAQGEQGGGGDSCQVSIHKQLPNHWPGDRWANGGPVDDDSVAEAASSCCLPSLFRLVRGWIISKIGFFVKVAPICPSVVRCRRRLYGAVFRRDMGVDAMARVCVVRSGVGAGSTVGLGSRSPVGRGHLALWGLVVLLGLGLCGCQSAGDGEAGGGAQQAERARLAGVWVVDFEVNQDLVDQLLDGDPERQQSVQERSFRGAAKQLLDGKIGEWSEKLERGVSNSMQLEFAADGTWASRTKMAVARGEKRGTWSIQERGEDFMLIRCTWVESKSRQAESMETRVTFLSPDRIRLLPPNMAGTELELTFVRQTAK